MKIATLTIPVAVVAALLAQPFAASPRGEYASAKRKFDLIESDKLKPGTRITLTQKELNAYIEQELPATVPQGMRNPRLEMGAGTASGSALVDFVKIGRAQGKPPGWLMTKLLEGEHPVSVTAKMTSSGGRATVEVDRVEVGGMAIEGRMLDFLIRNYLMPIYPNAKIGEPFEIGHHIESINVGPGVATVLIGR